jgi:hypothetical protein
MFRTSYVHHQEYYIAHAALYEVFQAFMQAVYQAEGCAWKTYHIRLHVQYSIPDDGRKIFETRGRQDELN